VYGGTPAVDRLDLEVEEGLLYGFLGPNGAGKTTMIRMALGLIRPSGGEVEVLGREIHGPGRIPGRHEALRKTGALVEEPAFVKYLSGRRNLEYHARLAGPAEDRDARLQRIDEVLQTVGLSEAAEKKTKQYSQGMRQRLGIAQALLGAPRLLVLDEPTNGLDPQGMREVRQLLRRLTDDGVTVFVSSHLLFEVEAMCDRVAVLARGRLVAEGPPKTLRRAGDRLRIDIDDRARALAVLGRLDGVTVIEDGDEAEALRIRLASPATPAAVNAALVGAGLAVSALVPEQDSLEDVFVALVEGSDVPR
jgi:ABC-2 type transport system ATP-binding protein